MQSPPVPRYLVPPRFKYSTQHHVLKHPQLPFLPQCQLPSFTPIKNNRQNYSSIYIYIYILIFKFYLLPKRYVISIFYHWACIGQLHKFKQSFNPQTWNILSPKKHLHSNMLKGLIRYQTANVPVHIFTFNAMAPQRTRHRREPQTIFT